MYDAYCPTCGDKIPKDRGYMATVADVFLKCPDLAVIGFLRGKLTIDEKKVVLEDNNVDQYSVLKDYYEAKRMLIRAASRKPQSAGQGSAAFSSTGSAAAVSPDKDKDKDAAAAADKDKEKGRPGAGKSSNVPAFSPIGSTPAAVGGTPAAVGGGTPVTIGGGGGRGKLAPATSKELQGIMQSVNIRPTSEIEPKKPDASSSPAAGSTIPTGGNLKPTVKNLTEAERQTFDNKIAAFRNMIVELKGAKTQPDIWHFMQELARRRLNDPSYELNTTDDGLFEPEYEKYVWAKIFISQVIVWENNGKFDPITSRILSFVTTDEALRIDIKRKFTEFNAGFEGSKYWELRRQMEILIPAETLSSYHDHYDKILKYLQPVTECTADFSGYIKLTPYEGENSSLANSAYYQNVENRVKLFRRVCPHCGADISLYSNIYPQEIISFIGTSTCGKSTTIVALYKELKNGAIPGVHVALNDDDPFAQQYKESLALMEKHLAIKKTNKDENPSLSAIVSRAGGSDRNIRLMTFVDIPGELLQGGNRCFGRFKIMSNSKMVCVVIAAEQLVRKKGNPMKVAEDVTAKNDPIELVGAIEGFREEIFQNREIPPVSLVISKADALEPEVASPARDDWNRYDASGYVTVEHPGCVLRRKGAEAAQRKFWVDSVETDNARDSSISEGAVSVDNLAKLYILLQNESSCYRNQIDMNYVDLKKMFELQEHKHRVLGEFRKELIKSILSPLTGKESWDDVPVFLLAAMGFYAVEDAWKTTDIDKHRSLNAAFGGMPNLSPEVFEQLKRHVRTRNECENFFQMNSTEQRILNKLGINFETVDRALKERYTNGHANKGSLGVKYYLYWMLTYTGVMDFLYNDYESAELNKKFIEFNRTDIEYFDMNTGATRRCDRHDFFAKYQPYLSADERARHPELTDLRDTETFKVNFIDMRKKYAEYSHRYDKLIDQMGWLRKHFYFINNDFIEIAECREKVTDSMIKKSETQMLRAARNNRKPLRIF